MPRPARTETCHACGTPDPWVSCPACRARLHPHCLAFGGCPCGLEAAAGAAPPDRDPGTPPGPLPAAGARASGVRAPVRGTPDRGETLPIPAARDAPPALKEAGAKAIDTAIATLAGATGLGLALGVLGFVTWGSLFASGVAAACLAHGINFGFFEGEGGASLGKKLMGLRRGYRRGRPLGAARGLAVGFALANP